MESFAHVKQGEIFTSTLFLGLNVINRKIAKSIPSVTQIVKLSDKEYAINTIVPFKTHQQRFIPGEIDVNNHIIFM